MSSCAATRQDEQCYRPRASTPFVVAGQTQPPLSAGARRQSLDHPHHCETIHEHALAPGQHDYVLHWHALRHTPSFPRLTPDPQVATTQQTSQAPIRPASYDTTPHTSRRTLVPTDTETRQLTPPKTSRLTLVMLTITYIYQQQTTC